MDKVKEAILNPSRISRSIGLRLMLIFALWCSFGFRYEESEEYSVKAAFIYKFTNYIDWGTLTPANDFVIGIVGTSPIKDQLNEIARTKTVNTRKIVIKQFNKVEDIEACQILFIPDRSTLKLDDILGRLTAKGTLTISERDGYAERGTEINFVEVDNKLKFEANPKAINAAGLKASSQLLKLAIIVE